MAIECSICFEFFSICVSNTRLIQSGFPSATVDIKSDGLVTIDIEFSFDSWGEFNEILIETLHKISICKVTSGIARVALYFDLSETIVFPFNLSCTSIKALQECGFSLDVTSYPCDD